MLDIDPVYVATMFLTDGSIVALGGMSRKLLLRMVREGNSLFYLFDRLLLPIPVIGFDQRRF